MGAVTKRLRIGGMTCPHCAMRVKRTLETLDGVERARVNYDRGAAEVTYEPERVSLRAMDAALREEGYRLLTAPEKTDYVRAAVYVALIAALYILLQKTGLLNRLVPGRLAESGMGYGMFFAVGLMTSLHCVAMCGGLGLSQTLAEGRAARGMLRPALLYNAGRVISYTATGFVMGLIGLLFGAGVNTTLSTVLQALLKAIAGAMMLCMGLNLLGLFPALRRFRLRLPRIGVHGGGALTVGLLNGLMPCGPLQSMQLAALASLSPIKGALSMLFFSLGTVPLMLGLGSLTAALGRRFNRAVLRAGAVLVAVMGLAMLSQGAALAGWNLSIAPAPADAQTAQTESGVQTVYSTLEPNRYPGITVTAGEPVRWVIDAPDGSINGCNNRILIPALDLEYTFQSGENVIEFTPDKAGTISYTCWMGMIRGTITVTDGDGNAA